MPSKVIIIVIQFTFFGINVFWVLLWAHFNPRLIDFSINLLVVYRESVNLIGYITVDYLTNRFHVAVLLFSNRSQMTSKYGKNKKLAHEAQRSVSLIVARVIVYVTLFQTWISTHGANGAPRLNLMIHNETVLFYALLDIFFLLCNETASKLIIQQLDYSPSFSTCDSRLGCASLTIARRKLELVV